MKKLNLLKLISLICVCAMLISALAVTAVATEGNPTVDIAMKNIIFGETIKLKFAITAPDDVVVTATCEGEEIDIKDCGVQNIYGTDYHVYETVNGWSAQNIDTMVTVTATSGNTTDVLDYSVLMYLYERLHLDNLDPVKEATRIAMYEAFLNYAILADKVINSEENGRTPNGLDEYYYVSVEGGTLDGYNTWGMFKKGTTPFANVAHNLEVVEGDTVEWSYAVGGENKGKVSLDTIKALVVDGDVTVTAKTACKHVYEYSVGDNNVITYACSKCGEVETSFTVGADGVNFFANPADRFACNIYNSGNKGNSKSWFGGIYNDTDNGVQYTRIPFAVSGQAEFLNHLHGTDVPNGTYRTQTVYGSGNYFVIKMRTASTTGSIKFAAISNDTKYATWMNNENKRTTFAEGWNVYVIDLSTFVTSGVYTVNDSSVQKALYSIMTDNDPYVDIAYFAVCDNWDEIASIVTDEKIILANWAKPEDDKIVDASGNVIPEYCDHAFAYAISDDGSVAYKCSNCNTTKTTFTIGADGVNWFSKASSAAIFNRYYVNNKGTSYVRAGNYNLDPETGIEFTRVTFQQDSGGGQGQFEMLNGNLNDSPNKNSVTQTIYGSGNYVVIKMRTNSTTSSLGIAILKDGTSLDKKDWMFGTNTRSEFAAGWAVYVIDLSKYNLCGTYTPNDSSLAKAMFNMRGINGEWVDISYFAVCDNWAEVKSVVTDEQIILTNWTDNNVTKTNLADYND